MAMHLLVFGQGSTWAGQPCSSQWLVHHRLQTYGGHSTIPDYSRGARYNSVRWYLLKMVWSLDGADYDWGACDWCRKTMLKRNLLEEVDIEVLFARGRWCNKGTLLKSKGQWIFEMVEPLPGEGILGMAELTTLARWKEMLLGCREILYMYVNVRFYFCLERLYLCTILVEFGYVWRDCIFA